jgi:hypothetical protein
MNDLNSAIRHRAEQLHREAGRLVELLAGPEQIGPVGGARLLLLVDRLAHPVEDLTDGLTAAVPELPDPGRPWPAGASDGAGVAGRRSGASVSSRAT